MDSKQSPAADFWAKVFLDRYPHCLKDLPLVKGPQGCMHKAAEEADIALAEFNRRFGADSEVALQEIRELRDAFDMLHQQDAEGIFTEQQMLQRYASVTAKGVAILDSALVTLSN